MWRTVYNAGETKWQGVKTRPLYNPEITLGEVLLKSMQVHGSKIAQISDDSGIQLTFDDIRERTIRTALNLQKRGYEAGQVFGIMAKNSHNVAPVIFAAYCLGCPYNSLATSFVKEEMKHMLNITKPSLIFCDVEAYEKMVESLAECEIEAKIITMNGKIDGCEQIEELFVETGLESMFRPTPLNGSSEIAAIYCSSGTTGLSKGVSVSHEALLSAQVDFELVHSDDVMLNFWEPFWLTSTSFLIWGTLYGATRVITTETETAELAFRLIEKYQVSFMFDVVPFLVEMLQSEMIEQYNLSSLRNYFCVGSKPPPGMLSKLNEHFPNGRTHNSIGMTEMAGSYAASCANYGDDGAAGQLANGIEAKIIDVNGNRCGPSQTGELYLKPRYPLLGYYNNPEATEQAFDTEGFLMTGDIGYFDATNSNLYVVDRKKDIIRYDFHQISPSEIEAALMKSPEIARVCVAGIPDTVAVDLPAAAIIRKEGSEITEKEVYDMVADNLPDKYKLRGGIYFMDFFSTTPSGKVLRRKVRDELIRRRKDKCSE